MALEVRFYTSYSKRDNSTKQPIATAPYTTANVTLKEPTSIESPTLLLSGNHFDYEYAYIPSYNKYYFVSQHVSAGNGLTQISLEEDVMATYKSAIGNTVAHIAYSSTGYDTYIVDPRIAVKTSKTIAKDSGEAAIFDSSGCYILTMTADGSSTGMTAQFAMEAADMRTLFQTLMTPGTFVDEIAKLFNQPFESILGCKWVPFSYSEIPGTSGAIELNGISSGASGKKISTPANKAYSVVLNIPWQYNDFRRSAPYTSISAWIPGFSYVDLNASDLIGLSTLKFEFMCDCATGNICCQVLDPVNNHIFASYSYDASVNVPISAITMNTSDVISNTSGFTASALTSMISAASGNIAGGIMGGVGMLASGANTIMSANARSASSKGSQGGRAVIGEGTDVILHTFSMETENPDGANYIAKYGRPVARTEAINTHSGYVQCESASVDIPGTEAERSKINSYLNSGFYYE